VQLTIIVILEVNFTQAIMSIANNENYKNITINYTLEAENLKNKTPLDYTMRLNRYDIIKVDEVTIR